MRMRFSAPTPLVTPKAASHGWVRACSPGRSGSPLGLGWSPRPGFAPMSPRRRIGSPHGGSPEMFSATRILSGCANRPVYPTPVQPVGRKGKRGPRIAPSTVPSPPGCGRSLARYTVASGVIKFTSRSRSLMAANRCSVPGPDRPGDARSPARAGARRSRGLSSSHSETATSGVSAPVGRERREGRQPRKEAFPLPNGADHRGCERPGHPADRVLAPHTPRACSWRCWCSRPTIARSWSS